MVTQVQAVTQGSEVLALEPMVVTVHLEDIKELVLGLMLGSVLLQMKGPPLEEVVGDLWEFLLHHVPALRQ